MTITGQSIQDYYSVTDQQIREAWNRQAPKAAVVAIEVYGKMPFDLMTDIDKCILALRYGYLEPGIDSRIAQGAL